MNNHDIYIDWELSGPNPYRPLLTRVITAALAAEGVQVPCGVDVLLTTDEGIRYPIYLPLSVVAKFLNMKPEGLRACIKQGRCPFGLGYEVDDKSAFKIPTETFFLWYTHAVIPVGI